VEGGRENGVGVELLQCIGYVYCGECGSIKVSASCNNWNMSTRFRIVGGGTVSTRHVGH
jgi:hypothetical protein